MSADKFIKRHIGPREEEISEMIQCIGVSSLDQLIDNIVPKNIRLNHPLNIPEGISEFEFLKRIKKIACKNKLFKSYIGTGYYNTVFPAVIQRNILENPSWYTSYTPYQAEISQGRLEALLNFQTVIADLTGMEIANASLLDESTAAAEAMTMLFNARKKEHVKEGKNKFFVDNTVFPQTIQVLITRAEPLGIEIIHGLFSEACLDDSYFGAMVQYPDGNGSVNDYLEFVNHAHSKNCSVAVSADLLSLVLLSPPGEWKADVVTGSAQRFGLPMGYGGPHAAFFATKEEFKRYIPGRIIGVSKDRRGKIALRMALQTREQHIKREKATSNICTSQALLAIMAGMYAVYHGPDGLKRIALHCHQLAACLDKKIKEFGFKQLNTNYFDTLKIELPDQSALNIIQRKAIEREINLKYYDDTSIGISMDETTSIQDLNALIEIFSETAGKRSVTEIGRAHV
jgi:glycine dehydrogenase